MFFSVSKEPKNNFQDYYQLGNYIVGTDAGWQNYNAGTKTAIYKGYADQGVLGELMDDILYQHEPRFTGNFCAIVHDSIDGTIQFKTDRYRGFPIYCSSDEVTNLAPLDWTAWTDSLVTIENNFNVREVKFDVIGHIDTSELSITEVVDGINNILNERTQNFIKYTDRPIRVFLSGGVDSLLVYSYLQKFTTNYELVKCQHIDYDRFWLMNERTLRTTHWGYGQIHHWKEPCVLTSGAPGDEFMLRSPTTADLYAKFHNIKVAELLDTGQPCLHLEYFNRPKHRKIFEEQELNLDWDRKKLYWELCNNVVNDWQHWHIGNTLTWTPLRDLEIFKLILRMPIGAAVGQIMNSDLSRALIEKNSMGMTDLISDQKNTGNSMKNLADFLLK